MQGKQKKEMYKDEERKKLVKANKKWWKELIKQNENIKIEKEDRKIIML